MGSSSFLTFPPLYAMRLVLAALCLLAAPGLRAQTAADSALVERTLHALQLERQMSTTFQNTRRLQLPGVDMNVGDAFSVAAIRDSIAARLYADFRPDRIDEALAYVESPSYTGWLDRAERLQASETVAVVLREMANPGSETLADEGLADRYLRRTGQEETTRALMTTLMRAMLTDVDLFVRMRASENLTVDDALDTLLTQVIPPMHDAQVLAARVVLLQASPGDVEAAIAYGTSPGGQYLNAAIREGMLAAIAPDVGPWMNRMFEALEAQQAAAPLPTDGVYDRVDQEPVMIGGLEGLMGRVVYPEAARRAAIEGTVYIQFVVDEAGGVRDAVVLRSPDTDLSAAALAAVRASQFAPGRHQGQAVRVRYRIPIRFTLTDDEPLGPVLPPTSGE